MFWDNDGMLNQLRPPSLFLICLAFCVALPAILPCTLHAQNWDQTSEDIAKAGPEAVAAAVAERASRADAEAITTWAATAIDTLKKFPPVLAGEEQNDGGLSTATNIFLLRDMLAYNSALLQHQASTDDADDLELGAKLFETLSSNLRKREMEPVWKDARTAGPLGRTAALLKAKSKLTELQTKRLTDLAVLQQSYLDDNVTDKQGNPVPANGIDALRRYEGIAWLNTVFPTAAKLGHMRRMADAHFADLLKAGDILGDSAEQAEGLARAVSIATARGSFAELSALKPAFERLRATLGPAGYPARTGGANWGPSFNHALALHAAARLFEADAPDDAAAYLEAADRAFLAAVAHHKIHHPQKTGLVASKAHVAMGLLNLPATELKPAAASTKSVYLPNDKLVLRPRHGADAPFLVLDFSAAGLPDQRPGIAAYAGAGTPLYRGADDKLWRAQSGNLLLVQQADIPYPFSAVRREKLRVAEKEKDVPFAYWDEGTGPFIEHFGIKDASVTDHDGYSQATITFAPYGSPESSLTRRLFLTTEGALVIHDTLTPGPAFDGSHAAGPQWPFESDAERIDNTFVQSPVLLFPGCHPAAEMPLPGKLVVAFDAQDIDQIGKTGTGVFDSWAVRKAARGSKTKGGTAYLKRPLTAGEPTQFITAALPVPADMDDDEAAKALRISRVESGAVDVSFRRGKETIFFTFPADAAKIDEMKIIRNVK